MIEAVEQTSFQTQEAITRGSLARQMVAMLIYRERFARRICKQAQACLDSIPQNEGFLHQVTMANAELNEACNAAESARRLLNGWGL